MSMFDKTSPAWTLGQDLKGATRERVAQTLAIAALSAARANGQRLDADMGKLAANFADLLARFEIMEPKR